MAIGWSRDMYSGVRQRAKVSEVRTERNHKEGKTSWVCGTRPAICMFLPVAFPSARIPFTSLSVLLTIPWQPGKQRVLPNLE